MPTNFCKITTMTNEIIDKVFPKLQKSLMAQCTGYIGSQNLCCKYNQYHQSKRNLRRQDNVPIHRYHNKSKRSCQNIQLNSKIHLIFQEPPHVLTLKFEWMKNTILLQTISSPWLCNGIKLLIKKVDEQYYRSYNFKKKV